jgi:cardiolipin synthase
LTEPPPGSPDWYRTWFEGLLGVPATEGNRVDVLRNGDQIFPAMLEAIRAATSTVDLATFNCGGSIGTEFLEALTDRAAHGVRVRVLLDWFGARFVDRDAVERLRSAGGRLVWFRPLSNPRVWETTHRGHRKVLVCDRQVAFTGGVGIDDRWRGDARIPSERRDTPVRVRGPAVDGLHGAFVNNWGEVGLPIVEQGIDEFTPHQPAGDSCVQVVRGGARTGWGDIATLVWALLALARHHIRIAAAYFVPDNHTLGQLCDTARRGVRIDLLVNGVHADKWLNQLATQGQYQRMLDAGIRVWCYTRTMLHAKLITVDQTVASIGSSNVNARSLLHDEELNLVAFDPRLTKELDGQFDADLEAAEPLEAEGWSRRGLRQRVLEAVPGFVTRHL